MFLTHSAADTVRSFYNVDQILFSFIFTPFSSRVLGHYLRIRMNP